MYPLLSLPSAQINLNKTIDRTKIMLFVVCFSRFLNIKQKFFETRQTTIESIKIFNSIFIIRWFIAFFLLSLYQNAVYNGFEKKEKNWFVFFCSPIFDKILQIVYLNFDIYLSFWFFVGFWKTILSSQCGIWLEKTLIGLFRLLFDLKGFFLETAWRLSDSFDESKKKFNKERKENLTPQSNLP